MIHFIRFSLTLLQLGFESWRLLYFFLSSFQAGNRSNVPRRWSSSDGGQTYKAFHDGIDDDATTTDSGFIGSMASLHSRMPLHVQNFEDIDLVGSVAQTPRPPNRRKLPLLRPFGCKQNLVEVEAAKYTWASRLEFVAVAFSLVQCSAEDLPGFGFFSGDCAWTLISGSSIAGRIFRLKIVSEVIVAPLKNPYTLVY